jgi:hypothetical protein
MYAKGIFGYGASLEDISLSVLHTTNPSMDLEQNFH